MKVIIFILLSVVNIVGLIGQDNLIFNVDNYESFSVYEDTILLKMETSVQYEEGIGQIETRWCNYQPLIITAYKLDTILAIEMYEHCINRTKNLFVKQGMFHIKKEYETDEDFKVIILEIENENLPMKYMVYTAHVMEDVVFDTMNMHIKDDTALEEYLAFISFFKFVH